MLRARWQAAFGRRAAQGAGQKLDKAVAKLANETDEQRQRRLAKAEKDRERAARDAAARSLDLYDFHLEGDESIEGRPVWVITATPKPGYHPKHRDAKPLLKIHGKLWIDKAEYQWVRIEAETSDTISLGWFIARLDSGAKIVFEQTRINDEIWLPKRQVVSGSGAWAWSRRSRSSRRPRGTTTASSRWSRKSSPRSRAYTR